LWQASLLSPPVLHRLVLVFFDGPSFYRGKIFGVESGSTFIIYATKRIEMLSRSFWFLNQEGGIDYDAKIRKRKGVFASGHCHAQANG